MKTKMTDHIPKFQSLQEERQYWEERGPLAKGRRGRVNRPGPGQKRSSFLVVRLSGEELTRLRDIAAGRGLGPSTFARLILTSVIGAETREKTVTVDQVMRTMEDLLPQRLKEKGQALIRNMAIATPDNPAMLILDASQQKAFEDFTLSFLRALLGRAGIHLVTPEDESYQKLKEMAATRA